MDRLEKTTQAAAELYAVFCQEYDARIPVLDLTDANSIEHVLNFIFQAESRCAHFKRPFPTATSKNLRKQLADVLLLLDGLDREKIKTSDKPIDEISM